MKIQHRVKKYYVHLDIYPIELRLKAFEFLLKHHTTRGREYLLAFIAYIKTNDFSDDQSRNLLIVRCQYVFNHLDKSNHGLLLEACVSRMTEQEIVDYIVPTILAKLKEGNIQFIGTIPTTLELVFVRVNQEDIQSQLFSSFLPLYLKHNLYDGEKLLSTLVKKLDSVTQICTCRNLLKTLALDIHGAESANTAYVLALLYKRGKDLYYDIPGFCNGKQYAVPADKPKCALM